MTAEDNQVVGRGTDRTNHGQYWTSDSPALLHVGTWLDIIQRMRPEGGCEPGQKSWLFQGKCDA